MYLIIIQIFFDVVRIFTFLPTKPIDFVKSLCIVKQSMRNED